MTNLPCPQNDQQVKMTALSDTRTVPKCLIKNILPFKSQKQGHYVAYVRVSQNWYQCDDERITPFGNNTPAPTRNAYLLLLKLADD